MNIKCLQLQQEIDETLEGRDVKLEDRDNMHYTMSFMQEVMRYRTLLPFSVPRMTTKDTLLGKYVIPKVL